MDQILPLRSRTIAALTLLCALVGCDQAQKKAAPAPADPKACEQFAEKICKETTDQSKTCTDLKGSVELLTPEACTVALASIDVSLKKVAEKRKKCDELTTRLCKDLGDGTQTCEMVKTSTKNFTPDRCETMLGKYDEVLAGLKKQEEKNKPLSAEVQVKLTQGNPPAYGPKESKVVVVEFSDFQCPYCSRAATTVNDVKKKYGDKVLFVFRQYPLSFHENAHISAEASLAAHEQGKFWELHDKMFENQKKLDRASLDGYAKDVGLNVAAFKKALDDKKYKDAVDAELKLGEEVAVDGTPTMFVNGKRVSNPTSVEEVSKVIDEALGKAG